MSDADVQATFAATLVDEWARAGLRDAVVAPGSRSTPLTLALAGDGRLRIHVVLDERSAGFVGLGLGLATGRPAVVVTTSGTAAVELHPAVVEADQAGVPLLAVTADRPPELHDVRAPQTIEQAGLYGRSVRWASSPGVPEAAARDTWRSLAARAVAEAAGSGHAGGSGPGPGPVHLNLAFREPLLGSPAGLPPARADGAPWHRVEAGVRRDPPDSVVARLIELAGRRGLIVAGGGAGPPSAVHRLAEALGWPVLADARSGCRVPARSTIAAADALLRTKEVAGQVPEVILRMGDPWVSRVVATWLRGLGPDVEQMVVDPLGRWPDPERMAGAVVPVDAESLSDAVCPGAPAPRWGEWGGWWATLEATAQAAFDDVLARHAEVTEPGVARTAVATALEGGVLFTSASMPLRDVEWYARPRRGLRVLANCGTNGIDGVVSTSLGVALAGERVAALVGDLAFLYDPGGLIGAAERGCSCTLVVVDNDGGGIFSFLPQADAVDRDRFERLWGTPHGLDLAAVAAGYGLPVVVAGSAGEVGPAVSDAMAAGGVRVVLVRTSRRANVAVHDELHEAVAAAVRRVTA